MTRFSKYLTPAVAALALSSSLLVAPPAPANAATGVTVGVKTPVSVTSASGVWSTREGIPYSGGRKCTRVVAGNTTFSSSGATLKLTKLTSKTEVNAAKAAKCSIVKKKKAAYGSAAVDTEDTIRLKSGRVEAKIKFPTNKGMHAGVWLQSNNGGNEIDMIESYGNRITNVYHTKTSAGKTVEHKVYNEKKSPKWYRSYHTFAVEFDSTQIKFFVDGNPTKHVKNLNANPNAEYFLVMSIGTADWEVKKINGKLPAKMVVKNLTITATS